MLYMYLRSLSMYACMHVCVYAGTYIYIYGPTCAIRKILRHCQSQFWIKEEGDVSMADIDNLILTTTRCPQTATNKNGLRQ